jgi:predicted RNA-binding protein with PIN domain
MRARWIIIDGYSLLHRMEFPRLTEHRATHRARLIQMLDKTAPAMADRVTVVFDGRGLAPEAPPESSVVEVVYSPAHQTADTVIEQLVCSAPATGDVLVVSSDRAERRTVEAAGALTMSCGDFLDECQRAAGRLDQMLRRRGSEACGPTLGDFFPKSGK